MLVRGGVDTLRLRESADRKLFLFIAAATVPLLLAASVIVATGILDVSAFARRSIGASQHHIWRSLVARGSPAQGEKLALTGSPFARPLLIGAAQAIALIPGASRSGVTITAARYLGWTREEAARFSMLLAIPAIGALGLFAAIEIVRDGAGATMQAAGIVAALSFATAYAAIAVLMTLTRKISFTPFVIYRVIMGVGLLIFAASVAA